MKGTISKIFTSLLVFVLAFTFGTFASRPSLKATSAFEVESDSYYISTNEDLLEFANLVNSGNSFIGKTVYLKNNINLEGVDYTPIGYFASRPFEGVFDGQGYVISNLTITSYKQLGAKDSNAYLGLFGYTKNAEIRKVGLKDLYIDMVWPSNVYAGGLIGYSENTTISESFIIGKGFDNIENSICVSSLYQDVKAGGIVGEGEVSIIDSYANICLVTKDNCKGEVTSVFDVNEVTAFDGDDYNLDSSDGSFIEVDLTSESYTGVFNVKDILGLKLVGNQAQQHNLSISVEDNSDIPLFIELDNVNFSSIAGTPGIEVKGNRIVYIIITGNVGITGLYSNAILASNITVIEKNPESASSFTLTGGSGQGVYTNATESNKNGASGNSGFEGFKGNNLAIYAPNTNVQIYGGSGSLGRRGFDYPSSDVYGSNYDGADLNGGAGGAGGSGAYGISASSTVVIDASTLTIFGGDGANGAEGGRGALSNRSDHAESGAGGAGGAGGSGAGAINAVGNIFIRSNDTFLKGGTAGNGGLGGLGRASYYSSGVYLDYAGAGGAGGAGGEAQLVLKGEEIYIDSPLNITLGNGGNGGNGGIGGNGTKGTGSASGKRNGTNGANGGAGGAGGAVCGDVSAFYFTNYNKPLEVILSKAGNGGAGGAGGNGGDGWSGQGTNSDLKGGDAGRGGRGGAGGVGGSVGLTLTARYPEVGTGGESGNCGSNGTRGKYVYEYKGGFLWLETKYENKYGASAIGYTKYDKAKDGTMPEVIGGFDLFTVYSGRFTAGQAYAVSSYNGVRVATLKNETDYTNFLDVLYTTDDGAYSTGSFLIGATDVRNEGSFVWTDGTSFNRGGDFNTGEPNNANGNEDILELVNSSYINDNNLHVYVNGVVFEDNQMVLEELTCDYQFKYLSQYAYTSGVVALSSSINLTRFYTMSQVASSDTYEEFVMSEITCSPDTVISKEYYYNWNDLTSGFDSDNELSYPTFDFKNVWIINGLKNYPYPVLRAFSGNIDDYLMEGYELTLEDGNLVDRNGLIYSLDSETKVATVIGIKEEMNTADHEVIILPYVNYNKTNYKVQIIGQGAFKNKHITNYTICDEIIEIEAEAFYKAKFTSFNFPKNLKVIGNAAFFNSSLEQIEIPNRLDLIKENAFANCQSLTSVILESDIIENKAFMDCGMLEDVNVNTIELGQIDSDALTGVFTNCNKLINLTLGNDLEIVGSYAFSNCSSLQTVTFGENLKAIGDNSFDTCIELKSIIFKGDCPASINVSHSFNNITNSLTENRYNVSIYYAEDKYFWDGIVAWVDSKGFITKKDLTESDLYISVINESLPILDNNKILNGQLRFSVNEETHTATLEEIISYDASELTIPGVIVYNGSEYTVDKIGSGAPLTSLNEAILKVHLPETIKTLGTTSLDNLPNLTHITFDGLIPSLSVGTLLTLQSDPIFVYYPSINGELDNIYTSTNICECIKLQLKNGQYVDPQFDLVYSKGKFNVYPDGNYAVVGIDVTADSDYLINTSGYVGKNTNGKTGYVKVYDYVSIDSEILEVKEISKYAFYKNEYLIGIEISKTIVEIKDCSFRETSSLEEIIVDKENTTYHTYDEEETKNVLFKSFKAGTDILVLYPANRSDSDGIYTIPTNVSVIENYAFLNTASLKEVIFNSNPLVKNEGLSTIGLEAFSGSGISRVDLGTTAVQHIGDYAFKNCHNLKEVILPEDLVNLGFEIINNGSITSDANIKAGANYSPFLDNVSIESFSIQNNDTFFTVDGVLYAKNGDNYILVQYPALKQGDSYYTTDSGVDIYAINQKAFSNTRFLSEIVIGSGVVQIGLGAFNNCINASTIYLPDTLVYLGIEAFDGCTKLSEIVVDSANKKYYSDDNGVLYEKTGVTNSSNTSFTPDVDSYVYRLIKYPQGITRNSYTMISTVTEIAAEAFYGNTSIKRLVLPSDNLTIEDKAFFNCSRLSQVYFTTKTPVSVGNYILYYEAINNGVITNNALDNVTIYYNKLYKSYWEDSWYGFKTEEYNILSALPEVSDPSASLLANPYKIVVVDSMGEAIPKASVVFEDKKMTTDENGQVVFDCSDYIENKNRVQVTKDGYYKYSNQEFLLDEEMRISFIVLYSEPEVYGINCLGKNIQTEKHEFNISADNKNKYDSVIVTVSGFCDPAFYFTNVTIYQVVDGEERELLTYTPVEGEYSNILLHTFDISKELILINISNPQAELFVKFTTSQFDPSLEESWEHRETNVLIINVDEEDAMDSFFDIFSSFDMTRDEIVIAINPNVPIVGGGELTIDISELRELLKRDKSGVEVFIEEGVIRVGFNCDVERWDIKCIQDLFDALDYAQGSPGSKDYYSQNFDFNVTFGIYVEYKYSEALSNPESVAVKFVGTIEIAVEIDFNTTVFVVIPVTACLEASAKLEMVASIGYDFERETEFFEMAATFEVDVKLSAGIGVSAVSVGLFGNLVLVVNVEIIPDFYLDSIVLTGRAGWYAQVKIGPFKFRYEGTLVEKDWQIYPFKKSVESYSKKRNSIMKNAYNAELYEIDDTTGESAVSNIKSVTLGTNEYIFFNGKASDLIANSLYPETTTKLMYQVHNTETDEYSLINVVDSENYSDGDYQIHSDGENIHIAYLQLKTHEDLTSVDGVKYYDVKYAKVNSSGVVKTLDVNNAQDIEATADLMPRINVDGSVAYVAWVKNTDNNIFGVRSTYDSDSQMTTYENTDANHIYYRTINTTDYSLGEISEVDYSGKTIIDLELHSTFPFTTLYYIVDEDCDPSTSIDRTLIGSNLVRPENSYTSSTGSEYLGEAFSGLNVIDNKMTYSLLGKVYSIDINVSDGTYYTNEMFNANSIASGYYDLVKDNNQNPYALVYAVTNGSGTDFYASYYDSESSTYTNPIVVNHLSDNQTLESFIAYYNNGLMLKYSYYELDLENNDETLYNNVLLINEVVDTTLLRATIDYESVIYDKATGLSTVSIDLTISNNSSFAINSNDLITTLTDKDGNEIEIIKGENVLIPSGEEGTFRITINEMDLTKIDSYSLSSYYNEENTDDNISSISFKNLDAKVNTKQVVLDGTITIIVKVENTGFIPFDGTLYFIDGVHDVEDDAPATAYSINVDSIKHGEFKFFMVDLNEYKSQFASGIVSVMFVPHTELNVRETNNYDNISVEALNGEMAGSQTSYDAHDYLVSDSYQLSFPKEYELDIELALKDGITFTGIEKFNGENSSNYYTYYTKDVEVDGQTVTKHYVKLLRPLLESTEIVVDEENFLSFTFSDELGNIYTNYFELYVAYSTYEITFNVYDKVYTKEFKYLETPEFTESTSVKPTLRASYEFVGWDQLFRVVTSDATYNAIYNEVLFDYELTYVVDGNTYNQSIYHYEDKIIDLPAPEKIGYSFVGWSNIPEVMPASNITVEAEYKINSYNVNYYINNLLAYTDSFNYDEVINYREDEVKVGYTFSGWDRSIEKMPAGDINLFSEFTINTHKLTYLVDGSVYKEYNLQYGTYADMLENLTRTGYTFSGWSGVVEVMPDNDVVVTGSFTINKYTVDYYVDGVKLESKEFDYNEAIDFSLTAQKEGYTFTSWVSEYEVMPAFNIKVNAEFSINSYKLTYLLDNETYKEFTVPYNAHANLVGDVTKEGYTFSGWSGVVEAMPASDVVVTGSFTINTYKVNYYVDGALYKSIDCIYNEKLSLLDKPAKVGYTFTSWLCEYEYMPAFDLNIHAEYKINTYKLTYILNNEVYKEYNVQYGGYANLVSEISLDGHTFSGWSGVVDAMPDRDVVVSGTLTVNEYTIRYFIDELLYKEVKQPYGTKVDLSEKPTKDGHTFSGWISESQTVPSKDIKVEGKFNPDTFTINYYVNGSLYQSLKLKCGERIPAIADPVLEGHTFNSWSNIPEVMPANSININGTFIKNNYKVSYYVDGEFYKEVTLEYLSEITLIAEPTKTGHTFSGWSTSFDTVPSYDIIINGSFKVNKYTLTYKVDGYTYLELELYYGDKVTPIDTPVKTGYTFSNWDRTIQTMPDSDVVLNAEFTIRSYKVYYYLDGKLYETKTVKYNDKVVNPTVEDQEFYKFSGWDKEVNNMPDSDVTIIGSMIKDTSLKAELTTKNPAYGNLAPIAVYGIVAGISIALSLAVSIVIMKRR